MSEKKCMICGIDLKNKTRIESHYSDDIWCESCYNEKELIPPQSKQQELISQIDLLANFIMSDVDGEPSQDEGEGECAIRIITQLKQQVESLREALGSIIDISDTNNFTSDDNGNEYVRFNLIIDKATKAFSGKDES